MRKIMILLMLLLSLQLFVDVSAQNLPLVYSKENIGADYPVPYMPSISQLPVIRSLPDPFVFADGTGRIKNISDWEYRRAEIGAQIQNYEIGPKPPRPDTITASYSQNVLTVNVTVNGRTITLSSRVVLPSGTGPFPAVIGMNSPTGSIPDSIFKNRNIAEITFSHDQVTKYGSPSTADPFYRLYPYLNPDNSGQYTAWAWGVSRIIDGLELVQGVLSIDLKHIAVTGCSYAGKMALFAGAFDERIALTIAQESGGGGATSWRYSHFSAGTNVEEIDNTDYNWFKNNMSQFSGDNVYKLPEDHHELMAMCAPRALYVTANPDYTWLSNPSCNVVSEACKQVYKALGVPDRFGYSVVGGHSHCAVPGSQIPEIIAFVDKYLLANDTVNTSNISDTPYNIDLSGWITWSNPVLSNDTTYFTKLDYPSDKQVGLDTSITFKWKKITDAQQYNIEVSTDPLFESVVLSDSTADTSKTISGLLKNQKYYWHVKVKSSTGSGLWSSVQTFITTLSIPATPKIESAVSNSMGYMTFKWNEVNNAEKYLIQIAYNPGFTPVFKSATAADTLQDLSWFSEMTYYWRVQASNLAGSGSWSDVGSFNLIYTPTNLTAQKSASNQVTLSWSNNSTKAAGNLIERKQDPQTAFSVIDTSKGNGNQYLDNNVEEGQTYTYRIQAYKDSILSAFSNEASLLVTSVEQDGSGIPAQYSISQNYPNPFNPTTTIKFGLPQSGLTKLIIYDIQGRVVQTLINKEMSAGFHTITFDASKLSNGVYFYRIQAGNFNETKKLILLK